MRRNAVNAGIPPTLDGFRIRSGIHIPGASSCSIGAQFRRSPAGRAMNQYGAAGENITAISAAILIRILNITFILNDSGTLLNKTSALSSILSARS